MHFTEEIVSALDQYMDKLGVVKLTPSEANEHLSKIGILRNYDRSGNELRRLCRIGLVRTARQPGGKNTKWIIYHSKNNTFSISAKLEKIIDSGKGEREVCAFLAKYPEIIRWAFCRTGGHGTWVLKEYPLGSRYKVDYVVITCYSGK